MSAVVYARVPASLKHDLEAHASKRGLSLTRAVVELVGRGLEVSAEEHSVTELEEMLALGHKGIGELIAAQRAVLASLMIGTT